MTDETKPTRWGIAACGKISHDFVACLRSMPEFHVIVACASSSSLDNAKKFASDHGIVTAYGSYEDLAKNPNIDVVYVGALNPAHFTVSKLMLNHGKNIIVEKPCGMNTAQVKRIYQLAREKNLFAMEGMWSRFTPSYLHMQKEIQKGTIGEVKQVLVEMGVALQKATAGHGDRILKRHLGGGLTLDMGVYLISFAFAVYGYKNIVKVSAIGSKNDEGCDDAISVSLLYSNGRIANLVASGHVNLPNAAHAYGTEGNIEIPSPFWASPIIKVNEKTTDYPFPDTAAPTIYPNSTGLRYEAMEVRRCLLNGLLESSVFNQEESLAMHGVMDQIRKQLDVVYDEDLQPQL